VTITNGQTQQLGGTLGRLKGGVKILSDPPEAEIYLNGEKVGVTPKALVDLDADDYTLTLKKKGYKDYTKTLKIKEGMLPNINVTMVTLQALRLQSIRQREEAIDGEAIEEAVIKILDNSRKAKKILADVVKACGGLEKLKLVKNIVAKGQLSVNTPGGMMQMEMKQYYVFPDKVRMDMTLQAMGMEISQVFDGQSAWIITPQGVQPFPESLVEEFKKNAFRDTIQLLTNLSNIRDDISVQYLGTEDVKGKMADVILVRNIRITPNTSGDSLKVFIDGETKYIVKKTYRAMSEEGPVDTEEFTDDYRDVSGVKNSFHTVINRNGAQYAEITLSELTINAKVDESLFEK
jgi:outer membrane lipoprotein-sorting protein